MFGSVVVKYVSSCGVYWVLSINFDVDAVGFKMFDFAYFVEPNRRISLVTLAWYFLVVTQFCLLGVENFYCCNVHFDNIKNEKF